MRSPLYRNLVRQVARGLSQEDGTELAVGLYRMRTEDCRWSLLGSMWLYYGWLVVADHWRLWSIVFWAEVGAPPARVARDVAFAAYLRDGLLAQPLCLWKVCQRGVGIAWATPQRRVSQEWEVDPPCSLVPVLAGAIVLLLVLLIPTPAHASLALFFPMYVQSGGNSMNAGSTTANAADVTQTNGSWDITADTFIATAATPFSAVTINVDYASIYNDGVTTGAVYVALITTVNSGGLSITLSTTVKYGTKPASGATGKSCKVNGAWADETAPVQLGSGAVPQSTKINWKQASYTVAASRTVALAGTTTASLWLSAYNTTPGDLDADISNALSKPVLALNSTFTLTFSGVYQVWSGFSITGSRSGTILTVTGTGAQLVRMRSDNTSANAAAIAFTATTALLQVADSWFRCPTTATTTGTVLCSIGIIATGTTFEGGGLAGLNVGAQDVTLDQCIFPNNTGSGILLTTGRLRCTRITVYNASVDGIKWTGTPTSGSYITASAFELCGGWGINNASGANTGNVLRLCNTFHACTSGQETGFGDTPAWFGQTDASTIVTSSTDMTPVAGSNARNNGFPGVFENGGVLVSQASYPDIGAVRHVDPAAGGTSGSSSAVFGS